MAIPCDINGICFDEIELLSVITHGIGAAPSDIMHISDNQSLYMLYLSTHVVLKRI